MIMKSGLSLNLFIITSLQLWVKFAFSFFEVSENIVCSSIACHEKTVVEEYLSFYCQCRYCESNTTNCDGYVRLDPKTIWTLVPATVEGMMGIGYGYMSSADIKDAIVLLNQFVKPIGSVARQKALDCGAGIGRITKQVLLPIFEQVDMVEQVQKFLDEAEHNYLDGNEVKRIGSFICSDLEHFTPKEAHYNVIWIQGVLEHLSEVDVVEFLNRCKKGITQDGLIFLKENIADPWDPDSKLDDEYNRYIRSRGKWISLIEKSELELLTEGMETVLYSDVLQTRTFVLK